MLAVRSPITVAIVTGLTIPGGVFVFFLLLTEIDVEGVMGDLPLWISMPIGLPALLAPMFIAGALWGGTIARLVGAPVAPAARTGGLSIMGMILVLEVPVHLSQALPLEELPLVGGHGAFTLIFMVEVAFTASVASSRLARRVGDARRHRRIGASVGLAAAAGFAVGSLAAVALGFRVGSAPPMNMVWALHVGNLGAGLAGGWVLGSHLGEVMGLPSQASRGAVEDALHR